VGIDYLTCLRSERHQSSTKGIVTTFDQAQAIEIALDAIGVRRVRGIVGASYGGMIALAFAARTPERVERVVAISAAHHSDPMATALRAIQRRIVKLSGNTSEGLALARALAMTTYRTRTEFSARFHNEPNFGETSITFPAEEYVIARGEAYADRATAKDFCAMTLSLDLHAVTPEAIKVPATLIGVVEDQLVSIERIRQLHRRLGGPSRLVELESLFGHDAFLKDAERMAPFITDALGGASISSIDGRNETSSLSHARAALGSYVDETDEQENAATRFPGPA
jgi:homoserine O-acetyltransferase